MSGGLERESEGKMDIAELTRMSVTRREALAGAAMVGLGAGLDRLLFYSTDAPISPSSLASEEFYGAYQAGIATAAQDFLHFAAFDLTSGAVDDLE